MLKELGIAKYRRKAGFKVRYSGHVILEDGQAEYDPDAIQARWVRHFSAQEAAVQVATGFLLAKQADKETNISQVLEGKEWEVAMTHFEWEKRIRAQKRGKAGGLDGLVTEAFQTDPRFFAELLHPLGLKQTVLGTEPIQSKGSKLCVIPKPNKPLSTCDSGHNIVLSNIFSKMTHAYIRTFNTLYLKHNKEVGLELRL